MEYHPIACIFPLLPEEDLAALAEDIKAHGLRQPIITFEGKVLDGRNRSTACLLAGVEPKYREFSGTTGDAFDFVWSENVHRRHLQSGQAAACHVKREKLEGELAAAVKAKRTAARDRQAEGGREKVPQTFGEPKHDRETDAHRAKLAGSNRQYINDADKLATQAPDLLDQVAEGKTTLPKAKRELAKRQKLEELTQREAANATLDGQPEWTIFNQDVMDGLSAVIEQHSAARMVFTDPPYNIGIDYGEGADADAMPDSVYMGWVSEWLYLCRDATTDDGSLWVMIGDEYAAEYAVAIKKLGLTIRSWIKWYETFGVNCQRKFNRTSRHIFHCVKDPKHFVFNADAVSRPSDRQLKYNDKRASEGGKIWDDVWQIPRLTGTCTERIPSFPTQLPLSLVRPIVLCASDPGDLVLDPFNGSGTTGEAAISTGRKYVGIEKSEDFADLADKRLKGVTCDV